MGPCEGKLLYIFIFQDTRPPPWWHNACVGIALPHDGIFALLEEAAEGIGVILLGRVGVRVVVVNRGQQREIRVELQKVAVKLITLIHKVATAWHIVATGTKAQCCTHRVTHWLAQLTQRPHHQASCCRLAVGTSDGDELEVFLVDEISEELVALSGIDAKSVC